MATQQRDPAIDRAKEAAQAAQEAAHAKAQTLFETNKDLVVSNSEALARVLRSASHELEEQAQPLARVAQRAADRIERLRENLEQSGLDDVIESVESYARRDPALFLGGAFLAGFALSRFLKASGQRRRTDAGFGAPRLPAQRPEPPLAVPVSAPAH